MDFGEKVLPYPGSLLNKKKKDSEQHGRASDACKALGLFTLAKGDVEVRVGICIHPAHAKEARDPVLRAHLLILNLVNNKDNFKGKPRKTADARANLPGGIASCVIN